MTTPQVGFSVNTIIPQIINNFDELTCTPKEFEQRLSMDQPFPPKVIVTGDLDLRRYTIKMLPAGLEVRGNLSLMCLDSLTTLPQGLKVIGNLSLNSCHSLKALTEELEVGDALYIYDCPSLTSLSQGLKLGGDLSVRCCKSLTSLPGWITTLGVRTDGKTREVYISDTGLSNAIIEELHQAFDPDRVLFLPDLASLGIF